MAMELRNFENLLHELRESFSRKQLLQHFHLYQDHVIRLYELEAALRRSDRSTANRVWSEYSDMRRRYAVAYNGQLLHELYFENLTADETEMTSAVTELIERDFGSAVAWEEDLRAAALVGEWVLLTYSQPEKKLRQVVVEENHIGVPLHHTVLMALDCWEHAWMVDFPGHIEDYVDVFMKCLNWNRVNLRLRMILRKK